MYKVYSGLITVDILKGLKVYITSHVTIIIQLLFIFYFWGIFWAHFNPRFILYCPNYDNIKLGIFIKIISIFYISIGYILIIFIVKWQIENKLELKWSELYENKIVYCSLWVPMCLNENFVVYYYT